MHRTISSIAEPTPLPDIADASIKHSGENPHSKRGRKRKKKKRRKKKKKKRDRQTIETKRARG